MQRNQEDVEVTVAVKVPCAACGCDLKGPVQVWEQWLCYPCIAKWDQDFPSDDEWYRSHPEDKERFAAKKSLTAQWVEIQRRRAA